MVLLSNIIQLIIIGVFLVIILAVLSPLESLGWWAGWSEPLKKEKDDLGRGSSGGKDRNRGKGASCYLVYLSGVGTLDPGGLVSKETNFLDRVEQEVPGAVVIRDVFPYAVNNNPLTGERLFAAYYRWTNRVRRKPGGILALMLAQLRNVLQVITSADRRYGPIYGFGVAKAIASSLARHGYRLGDRAPVVVVGLSGGGQVSVGCVRSLRHILGAPVWIISVGGVLTDDRGILAVTRLFHLAGSKDNIQYVGNWFFPGCWRVMRHSAWNRARRQGLIRVIDVGPMKHMGWGDYFSRSATLPDGTPHIDKTVVVVKACLQEIQAEAAQLSRSPTAGFGSQDAAAQAGDLA